MFTLRLPFGAAHLPAHRWPQRRAPPGGGQLAQGFVDEALRWLPDAVAPAGRCRRARAAAGRGRIVLADDNADMRAYIKRILEEGGYEVEAVANGRQALEAVARRQSRRVCRTWCCPTS